MIAFVSGMSVGDLFFGGFALVVTIGFLGVITNAVLKDAGFGAALNGCLLFAGVIAGAAARAATLGFQ